MNNLILLGKIFNMLIIFYLIYKIILKRKYSYLNTFFCFLIIFLSLVCVLLINSLSYNIFIFLILIITFLIIDNIPDKFEFEKTSIIIRDGRINFIDLLMFFLLDNIKHKNKNIKYYDSPKIISGEVLFLLYNK